MTLLSYQLTLYKIRKILLRHQKNKLIHLKSLLVITHKASFIGEKKKKRFYCPMAYSFFLDRLTANH